MNTFRASLLAVLALALVALDCAGADTRETRNVSGFSAIQLSVPAKVTLTQGNKEGLAIEGDAEDLAAVETIVEDGKLEIRPKSRFGFRLHSKLRIAIDVKQLERISIAGAGDVAAGELRTPSLKLSIAGSGDIRISSLDTERADVSISGSGDMHLAGRAAVVDSRISGSGDVKAERLEARRATIAIAGAGDVSIWAREALAVKIAGAGDVRYYGDPTIERKIMGAGSLKRLGASPN